METKVLTFLVQVETTDKDTIGGFYYTKDRYADAIKSRIFKTVSEMPELVCIQVERRDNV